MSGVMGVVARGNHDALELSTEMAKVMSHRDWYVSDLFEDQSLEVALGRMGIGIFNKDPQPVWNSDHSIALVMAGEFYNDDIISKSEIGEISQERAALTYYEKYGQNFPFYLNGAFIIAILDKNRKQLILANDRFGLYPLYYTTQNKSFIFSPEIKGILCDTTLQKKLDIVALAQYMRFQHLLGKRTFFENIETLPNASILVYDLDQDNYSVKEYWSLNDIPYNPNINFDEAVEETARLLQIAVDRLTSDNYNPGVFLSGGLDSRTIIGLSNHHPIPSFTWGPEHCRDVRYARKIASAVGSENHWFDLTSGKWVEENVDFHLELTEGFHSWIHSHGIHVLPYARQLIDVNLTGWDGSAILGRYDPVDHLFLNHKNEISTVSKLFQNFTEKYTWPSITEGEEGFLYTNQMYEKIQGLALDSFCAEFDQYKDYRDDIQLEAFLFHNHCGRLTKNMITVMRSHVEARFTYLDYDLLDFSYSLPTPMRLSINYYRSVIRHMLPRLALIPYDRDQYLPTSNRTIRGSHALLVKLLRRLRNSLNHFPKQDTLYADYENYLRGDLKTWGEKILFDPSVKRHGIFNPAFIESIWDLHQSGEVEWTIGKIAPIMTYEMMLSRLYD